MQDMIARWPGVDSSEQGAADRRGGAADEREVAADKRATMFLNKVSSSRVGQLAKKFGSTPHAVFTVELVVSSALHPPGFHIRPMEHAPKDLLARQFE